jgi:hypothetical protein
MVETNTTDIHLIGVRLSNSFMDKPLTIRPIWQCMGFWANRQKLIILNLQIKVIALKYVHKEYTSIKAVLPPLILVKIIFQIVFKN